MTVFTPVNGNGVSETTFSVPLFSLNPVAYAGQTIDVDLFDPGDVNGGAAYMGLQAPDGTWTTVNSITDLGASLGGASRPLGKQRLGCVAGRRLQHGLLPDRNLERWRHFARTVSGVQLQMTVTSSATGYYSLVYDVGANATAADTFAVEVGFSGSPDHLLP